MPCRTDDYPSYDPSPELKRELDKLTEMLCSTCGAVEEAGAVKLLPKKVATWWNGHKKKDKDRVQRDLADAQRAVALAEKEAARKRLELSALEKEADSILKRKT